MIDYIVYALFFIVGAVLGSFSNVVIFRLPQNISLISPPSTCFCCNEKIKVYDNIPILSYIILRGKCRKCKAKIPFRDFLVELLNALLYLAVAILFFNKSIVFSIFICFAISILIIIACIDLDYMYIPNSLLIALSLCAIVITIFYPFDSALSHIIGLAIGAGVLLLIYGVGYLLVKREVVGLGDVKLMAVLGLLLGWKNILFTYVLGFVLASIVLIIVRAVKKDRTKFKEYPFAPALAAGAIVSIFFGLTVFNAYLGLFM